MNNNKQQLGSWLWFLAVLAVVIGITVSVAVNTKINADRDVRITEVRELKR